MNDSILTSLGGAIATVTLNRPDKLNALNRAMWQELGKTIPRLSGNDTLRSTLHDQTFAISAAIPP